ncbi:hypothetical protein A9Q99_11585 [Gammaproteobacteria bacterium 45_16_T64]|nr:hypothetical protein A9Q99_11585 [Gammaproteobacteria bacterium 45_16_T64]
MNLVFKVLALVLSCYLIGQTYDSCHSSDCGIFQFEPTAHAGPLTQDRSTPEFLAPEFLALEPSVSPPSIRFSQDVDHSISLSLHEADDGIEGTGHSDNTDSRSSFYPPNTIVEGGIEGTGINDGSESTQSDDALFNDENDEDGIEGTGIIAGAENQLITYGPITQFGSIYVNGAKYEIDDAAITFTNNIGNPELRLGMMVQVNTDWQQQDNGVFTAQSVLFDKQLEGPIASVTAMGDTLTLTVLGSTVIVDNNTSIHRVLSTPMVAGKMVTVSGITNEKQQLLATYISVHAQPFDDEQDIEFEATIQAIDHAEQRLTINGMSIDVSHTQWKHSTLDSIQVGDKVEVIGQYHGTTHSVTANRIRYKRHELDVSNGNRVDLDTFVTHYKSNNTFQLNGFASDASNAHFVVGNAEDLRNGTRIRAVGYINNKGTFAIRSIRIKEKSKSSLKAPVSSIDTTLGSMVVLGLEGKVSTDTLYNSTLEKHNKYISLRDIEVGSWVDIKGRMVNDNFLIKSVSEIAPRNNVVLKGPITKNTDNTFSIAGIRITHSALLSAQQMAAIRTGNIALVKGAFFDSHSVHASEIKLMSKH